ncbi:MAG TPA: hypothetical protein VEY11_04430 [Pyrinomonadaceae bacterium]|nr:hypothetical protein [Pyrinomonadaceae bacterium]
MRHTHAGRGGNRFIADARCRPGRIAGARRDLLACVRSVASDITDSATGHLVLIMLRGIERRVASSVAWHGS